MFGFDDHRFHMFTDDMRGGERGRSDGELLPDATHTVIVHFMISPEAMTKTNQKKSTRKAQTSAKRVISSHSDLHPFYAYSI